MQFAADDRDANRGAAPDADDVCANKRRLADLAAGVEESITRCMTSCFLITKWYLVLLGLSFEYNSMKVL